MDIQEIKDSELEQVSGGAVVGCTPNTIYSRARAAIGLPAGSFGDTSAFVSYCITGQHTRIGTTQTFMGWPTVMTPVQGNICTNASYCGIYAGNGRMIYVSSAKGCVIEGNMAADMIVVRYAG